MPLSVVVLSLVVSASASAAAPDFVLRMPESEGLPEPGAGAASSDNPRGVAGNPDTGRVYVADLSNSRINEYTAWGLFVKAWGWDVAPEGAPGDMPADELETCGPAVPEAVPDPTLCQAGVVGSGRGQFNAPRGLAVDSGGDVYVFDANNRRVQKFSPPGQFLLMFGGDVNKTKVEAGAPAAQRNVCPVDPGDVCQAGTSGEDPSQLDATLGDFIAYNSALDAIVVGDKGRIQIFDLDGAYREEIAFEGPLAALAGKQVNGLDVDSDGNIYFSLSGVEDIFKLSPSGEPLSPGKPGGSSFDAAEPLGVAVDMQGSVYAIDDPNGLSPPPPHVLKYNADGEKLLPTETEEGEGQLFPPRSDKARLTAIATNFCSGSEEPGNLYVGFFNAGVQPHVSYVDGYGTGPVGCEPPPQVPPLIGEQLAISVGREEATVRALINPKFFDDAVYRVEYGTGICSEGGCPSSAPVSPALLTDRPVNVLVPTVGVILEGLASDTTYHYRFVAQSSGGGPVYGVDPDGAGPLLPDQAHGLEAIFTTYPARTPPLPCSNDAFRIGPGAELPDCRAYELVSPLDKGNGDVALGIGRSTVPARLFETDKSALSGERFTFTSAIAFGDAQSAPFASQYLAERGTAGWGSKAISAPRTEAGVEITSNFGAEYQGFTDDLCRAWLRLFSVAPLTEDAAAKYPNLYRRDNCAEPPAYTALITKENPLTGNPDRYRNMSILGFSADGSHTIFRAPAKLDPGAPLPDPGEDLLYDHAAGTVRFVCYRTSGKAISESCSAGGFSNSGSVDQSSLHNAISADGSRIFWTEYNDDGSSGHHPGRIFVRIDGEETVAVSGSVSDAPAFFWTAADDGSKAIFSFTDGPHKGELYEFDVDAEAVRLIAGGSEGPMGASEDASRVYFASSEDLDGAGPAAVGAHNLYFYEADPSGGAGSFDFIMPLTSGDVSRVDPAPNGPPMRPVHLSPAMRAARVTPDGLHVAFASVASPTPTGYDNRDATSGKAAVEVYLYDAAADRLLCVSCNASGARPAASSPEGAMTAARIQGWEANLHAPRVMSEDGSRVFFESHEALIPEDANGTWDVYQWEEPGTGTCTGARSTHSEATGGCVDMLSSGQSQVRSIFLDGDRSGDSVFFATQSSLVGTDYGLNDVYVARVGGGFPQPPASSPCEGEACQSPPPAPAVAAPGSESLRGPGDKTKRRCPKGKRKIRRKGRVRCVKRSQRSAKKKQASRRNGGRR